jgi:hypothetical protein
MYQEDELTDFTKKYCRKKSLADIPPKRLQLWKELTRQTAGRYLKRLMSPAEWGDSIASLQTAVAILITYTPAELKDGDAYQQTLTALNLAILKAHKRSYEAKHGKQTLKSRRT